MWFWKRKSSDPPFDSFFKNILGFRPRNSDLYRLALIHRSKPLLLHGQQVNNERLEYLGDAVLSAIVAEYLYHRYPNAGEGFLTETRSKIVSRSNLGNVAQCIGLLDLVQYDRNSPGLFISMGGDAFEALIGAIYLDKGYRFAQRVVIDRIMASYINIDEIVRKESNYKGRLIDWGQKNHRKVSFEMVRTISHGRHDRHQYECVVYIDGHPAESAIDFTIKAAEQQAAEKALKKILSKAKS